MGVDCLFFLVISTRSFDYVNHILSARSPRSYSRAIAHNFHPRSMIGVSFLESSWRDVISNWETSKLLLLYFFHCWEFYISIPRFARRRRKPGCIFLRADVDHLSVEICRVVFLFERKRRLD